MSGHRAIFFHLLRLLRPVHADRTFPLFIQRLLCGGAHISQLSFMRCLECLHVFVLFRFVSIVVGILFIGIGLLFQSSLLILSLQDLQSSSKVISFSIKFIDCHLTCLLCPRALGSFLKIGGASATSPNLTLSLRSSKSRPPYFSTIFCFLLASFSFRAWRLRFFRSVRGFESL